MPQAKLMIATGRKGVGKTTATRKFIASYLKHRKKRVLITDVNMEYTDVPVIKLSQLEKWLEKSPAELRRIVPLDDNNVPLDEDEFRNVMFEVFKRYHNGLIVLEDFNRFFLQAQKRELVGIIITNRVRKIDVIIHLQSLNAVGSRFFQNTNVFRIHPQFDPIAPHKYKIMPAPALFAIATSLMDLRYRSGRKHTYCYVDLDIVKIVTDANISELKRAIVSASNTPPMKDLIGKYMSELRMKFKKADIHQLYNIALKYVMKEIVEDYYQYVNNLN